MLNESENDKHSETSIQVEDLIYPFAVVLIITSFFHLSGNIFGIMVLSLINLGILPLSPENRETTLTIINLALNLVAQVGAIVIFIFLYRSKRVEPEEKKMPHGNHFITIYLIYALDIVFLIIIIPLLGFLLEPLGESTSTYEGIAPSLETLNIPLYYVLFFSVLTIGAAIYEELVFRKTLIPFLERRGLGTLWVLVFSSLMFSLIHTPGDLLIGSLRFAIEHFFTTFAFGLGLGFLYMRTRDIRWPIILHGFNNGFAGLMMIGLVRYEEMGDLVLVVFGGLFVFTTLALGVGTIIAVIIQLVRYWRSPHPPAWIRIISDVNFRSTRLLPVFGMIAGFIFLEGGIPIVFEIIIGFLGEPSPELSILQYMVEIGYLILMIAVLGVFIYKRTGPLQDPDWVSDLTFPETPAYRYSYDYPPSTTVSQNLCSSCGQAIVPDSQFCVFCGTKIVNVCKSCGRPVVPNTQFCVFCGTKN